MQGLYKYLHKLMDDYKSGVPSADRLLAADVEFDTRNNQYLNDVKFVTNHLASVIC
jgi:hypothetical protein